MVNFGLNSASILGLFLAVAGASLYFMRSVRPELSRDHDIFFAAVGLLCGFILLFQGWRLDPILQFGQFLLSGSAIFFAVESIRLRGVTTEQAKRNIPTVDNSRERSVSRTRVYRAELDRLEPYDYDNNYENDNPDYDNPRLRGYQSDSSGRSRNNFTREDSYKSGRSRRSGRNSRRSTTRSQSQRDSYSQWEQPNDAWEDSSSPRPASPGNQPNREDYDYQNQKPSRRTNRRPERPTREERTDSEPITTDYVDYQPFDENERLDSSETNWQQDSNNSPENEGNFDY